MIRVALVSLLLAAAGCATVGPPVPGLLFTNATSGLQVVSPAEPSRVGEACSSSILGLVAFGNGGIEAAAQNGEIKTITSVDQRIFMVVGPVFTKRCTVVRGN